MKSSIKSIKDVKSVKDITGMIDISCVKGNIRDKDIKALVDQTKEHSFKGAFVLPYYVKNLYSELKCKNNIDISIGSVVGFPSGAHTTRVKEFEAKQLIQECDELDMVINFGALHLQDYNYVQKDIDAISKITHKENKILKVILEIAYLSDDEIERACKMCIHAGADFVKTSTGWVPNAVVTAKHIAFIDKIMKKIEINKERTEDDAIKIKASGGIQDLETLIEMHKHGASRFGMSTESAVKIIKQVEDIINKR